MTDPELREQIARDLGGRAWNIALPRHRDRLRARADAILALPTIQRLLTDRPTPKRCPECGAVMDPTTAWWWTAYGATDTENCARLLVERLELEER